MKKKLLRFVSLILLGGFLAVPTAFGIDDLRIETKAEDSTVTSKIVPTTFSSDGYDSANFTVNSVTFGRANFGSQSKKLQIKKGTSNGVWNDTVPSDSYISAIKITTLDSNGSVLSVGKSKKTNENSTTFSKTGEYSYTYTENNGYTYFSLMSNNSGTPTFSEISVTFTAKTGTGGGGGSEEDDPPVTGESTYSIVTDAATLKAGDIVVIGCSEKNVVAGAFENSYLKSTSATIKNGVLTSENANEITLSGSDGAWSLITKQGTIGSSAVKSLNLTSETTWDIDISGGAASISASGLGSIQYNASSPRFANYTSTQTSVEIYKKGGSDTPTTTYSLTYDSNGGTGSLVDSKSPYFANAKATVLENSFTAPEGKQFLKWNTKQDGSGDSYNAGESIQMSANVTLYAIWEDKPVLEGAVFSLVTSPSQINNGDLVYLAYINDKTVKVNGGANSDYLDSKNGTLSDGYISSEEGTPLVINSKDGYYSLKVGTKFITENDSGKFAFGTTEEFCWTIEIDANNNAKIKATDPICYNTSAPRFRTYSSAQADIKLFRKVGTAKTIKLSETELTGNVGETLTVSVEKVEGVTVNSYLWSLDGTGMEIVGANNLSSVQVKLTATGSGTLKVSVNDKELEASCLITSVAIEHSVLEEGAYYISDSSSSYLMESSIACSNDLDFSNTSNMWTFEYCFSEDNSYYIKNSLNQYLSRQNSIDGKGTRTQLGLSPTKYDYWTISKDSGNGYYLYNSSSTSSYNYYLGPSDSHDVFRAVTSKVSVHLTAGVSFDKIIYEGTLAKTTYNVDEKFDSTGLTFYALFSDGVTKAKITSPIIWDAFTPGATSVTGKVVFGGVQRTVEVTGLTITNYQPESISLSGDYKVEYYVGESVDLTGIVVTETLKDGDSTKNVTLDSKDYDFIPKRVDQNTSEIKVFLKADSNVFKTFSITKLESSYVVANHVDVGDKIVIGKLDYNESSILGGMELDFVDDQPKVASFDYAPRGLEEFEVEETSYSRSVEGVTQKAYALKNTSSGKYLRQDGKTFDVNKENPTTCGQSSGVYDFDYYFTYNGISCYVEFDGGVYSNGNVTGFHGYGQSTYNYQDPNYMQVQADAVFSSNGTAVLTFDVYLKDAATPVSAPSVSLRWSYDNGIILYFGGAEETITKDAAWFLTFDKNFATWDLTNYGTGKSCTYNSDGAGKFGFYDSGFVGEDIVIYRNNEIALKNAVSSISINKETIKTEYTTGDTFAWTGMEVTAYYQGGISSVVPVGGYSITSPDMTTAGTKTVTVSYGPTGNVKTDSFTITVSDPAPVKPTLTSIVLTKEPTKNFMVGDKFVFDGEVTAYYSDGSSKVIDVEDLTGLDNVSMTVGQRKVTIGYTEDGVNKTVQYTITVAERPVETVLQSIAASGYKDTFYVDEQFEFTGKVTATYLTGTKTTTEEVNLADCIFSSFDMTAGNKQVTISYTKNGVTVTTTINILVKVRPYITSIEVSSSKTAYLIGENFDSSTISAVAHYNEGEDKNLSVNDLVIDSSNYDKNKEGKYTITVTLKDSQLSDTFDVTVSYKLFNEIVLRYTSSKIDAKVGDEEQLVFKSPSDITFDDVTCTSSNEEVATVNSEGKINYVGIGTCTITVSAKHGSGVATYSVVVNGSTTAISLNQSNLVLANGSSFKLEVSIEGATLEDEPVSFTSSNSNVVTVDEEGNLAAVSTGEAVIIVTSLDGKISTTCAVTVIEPVVGVSLDKESAELNIGDTLTLVASINPSDATNKNISWASSDESVATVDNNGKVTAIAEGTAVITVTTSDGNKVDSCTITIVDPITHVTNVTLDHNNLYLTEGDEFTLTATVTPSDATNNKVIWSSSNTSVVTVDQNGNIKAIGEGDAVITVTTEEGSLKATCSINVSKKEVTPVENEKESKNGCGGSLLGASILVTSITSLGLIFISNKKKKEDK